MSDLVGNPEDRFSQNEAHMFQDATTSALTLSNVSGIFHILVAGLVLAMVVALMEYFVHKRIRVLKRKSKARKVYD